MSSKALLAAIALSVVAIAPAVAADYEPPIVIDDTPEVVPVEIGSGWYLRGDVGYIAKMSTSGAFDYRTFNTATGTYGAGTFNTASLSSKFSVNGGVGYHFNDWLRTDLTAEWFDMRFDGTTSSATPCATSAAFIGTTCRSEDGGWGSAVSFMANAYADLGTIKGFTPYIGGGLGYTMINWHALTSNNYCVAGAAACPAGLVSTDTGTSATDWAFTYGAAAGVAFDVATNFKIDVGYRYRHISGGDMFGWSTAATTAGATGMQATRPAINLHEIRVGVRYDLW